MHRRGIAAKGRTILMSTQRYGPRPWISVCPSEFSPCRKLSHTHVYLACRFHLLLNVLVNVGDAFRLHVAVKEKFVAPAH
jgi:hypothetical protein